MLLEAGERRRHRERTEQAQIVALGFNDPAKLAEQLDKVDPEKRAERDRKHAEAAGDWDADWLDELEPDPA